MIVILCSLLLNGCAETKGKVEPLPVPDRAKIPDNTGYVDAEGNLVAGPPLPGLRFAESDGTCGGPPSREAFLSCCGGKPCNGHCVTNDDGTKGCSCFGVAGGCPAGYVCSKEELKCVKAETRKPGEKY
jgi:hypothetical protein